MSSPLQGKRALVTGSSGGIGSAIGRKLAADGAFVVIHGRKASAARAIADEIVKLGGAASVALGDLATDSGAKMVAESAGSIDILINNCGAYENRSWETASPDNWLTLYNANVVSMVRMIRRTVSPMRARGWGRVIQLASGEATAPFAFMPDYAATKAAIVNLTVSLSKELAGTGITVNTVSPGIILTAGVENFYRSTALQRGWGDDWPAIERRILSDVWPCPVGRLGRPEDVAHLVAFLVSPAADFCNGANYRIDGGNAGVVN